MFFIIIAQKKKAVKQNHVVLSLFCNYEQIITRRFVRNQHRDTVQKMRRA